MDARRSTTLVRNAAGDAVRKTSKGAIGQTKKKCATV
jgi:hypothetical protein